MVSIPIYKWDDDWGLGGHLDEGHHSSPAREGKADGSHGVGNLRVLRRVGSWEYLGGIFQDFFCGIHGNIMVNNRKISW